MRWFTRNNKGSDASAAIKAPKKGLSVYEIVLFPILGALMFATKLLMEALPNIHLLGLFIVAFTLVFRWKALYPIYIYVFLDGIFQAFSVWWVPYLYIWTLLWGAVMLLPKNMPKKVQYVVYPAVCGLHGFLFGTLYSPVWGLLNRMSWKAIGTWIIAGLPYDAIHGVSNIVAGLLIVPLVALMRKLLANRGRN